MNTKFLLSSDNNNRNELLKKKIIHYYIANGDATIADLGREMDLSIPTVTKLVAELQDDGYILDFGKQETNGGRKPNIYGLNPASGYFVGVDMLKDKLNIAAIDFKGDKVQLEENIPYQLENTPASLEQFCKIIDDFIVSLPVERNKILAIGVNITGRVNPASGYSYSIFYFEEKPLAQILEERLQTKVFIENDSRAMTYGEYMKGVVQGEKNILFVNMAWGLGLGIIIDGNLYYGKSGFSGELGHFCMFENEVLCHYGKKGCLETVGPNGEFIDSIPGRTINPGHSIETAWFILEEAKHRNWDPQLKQIGLTILDWSWEWGWDKTHGGITYFRDCKNRPQQEYWHDMKFWWPQCEAIIATLYAYEATGDPKYLEMHKQINEYTYARFPDKEYGEWFGYFHYDGTLSQPAKGNMYKGPFHIPRMLLKCHLLCKEIQGYDKQ